MMDRLDSVVIAVRCGFGELDLSELAPNEFVMASGQKDGGYIVCRRGFLAEAN